MPRAHTVLPLALALFSLVSCAESEAYENFRTRLEQNLDAVDALNERAAKRSGEAYLPSDLRPAIEYCERRMSESDRQARTNWYLNVAMAVGAIGAGSVGTALKAANGNQAAGDATLIGATGLFSLKEIVDLDNLSGAQRAAGLSISEAVDLMQMAYKWLRAECSRKNSQDVCFKACIQREYLAFQAAYARCLESIQKMHPYVSTTAPLSGTTDAPMPFPRYARSDIQDDCDKSEGRNRGSNEGRDGGPAPVTVPLPSDAGLPPDSP